MNWTAVILIIFGSGFLALEGQVALAQNACGDGVCAQDDEIEVTQYTIKHSTKQMGQATSDMGLVYFIRPSWLAPRSYSWAFVDDQFIGVTDAKNYTYGLVSPGIHTVWSRASNLNYVTMNIEAGKTYYLQQMMAYGSVGQYSVSWAVHLREAKEKKLEKYFKKSTYVTPTEEAHAKAQEYIEERYARARAEE